MDRDRQDALYVEATAANAAVIRQLARGYEADPDRQRDLVQEIYLELWLSLRSFDGRCSLRTWVYRIAHNVGVSHAMRGRRLTSRLVDLETLEARVSSVDGEAEVERRFTSAILLGLIRRLKPLDRQVIMLYLEGEVAGSITEVTGMTGAIVATKIHRIKKMLKQKYLAGAADART